jgi:hypothetical protein
MPDMTTNNTEQGDIETPFPDALEKNRQLAKQLHRNARAVYRAMEGWQRVCSEEDWISRVAARHASRRARSVSGLNVQSSRAGIVPPMLLVRAGLQGERLRRSAELLMVVRRQPARIATASASRSATCLADHSKASSAASVSSGAGGAAGGCCR